MGCGVKWELTAYKTRALAPLINVIDLAKMATILTLETGI